MTARSLSLVLAFAAVLPATVHAQPDPFGCHHFRQPFERPAPLTDAQRSQIAETIARSDTFDILHYDIALDLTNYDSGRLWGSTTISFRALQPGLSTIRFDLVQLNVDSVIGAIGALAFAQDENYLDVQLGEVLNEGDEREVVVHYQGIPRRDPQWGGFYFESQYMYNLGIGISTIPPNFGKVWYPCFDSFVERATYTWHVKSAGTYRFHGQGTFLGEVQLAGDTVIRSYGLDQSIPTYSSAVAVADYSVHTYDHEAVNGPVPVTICAKPANLGTIVGRMVDLPAVIDACEHWYGPYPFDRVGYVLTTDGALEIPTNIAYPQFMTGQSQQRNRELMAHELGHMWWGNMITPFIHNEMWLKEGPAEYSTHLVEEWIGGRPALEKAVKDNLLFILRQAHLDDEDFLALSPTPDPHIYGTHTYYKGAAVMHNLRGYMGDEPFRLAMRALQEQNAYTTMTAEEFRDMLEDASGLDLDPFFDAWVFAPGYSTYEVTSFTAAQAGAEWQVDVTVGQKLRGATVLHQQVPLDLTFISASGEVFDSSIVVDGESSSFTVTSPFQPAMAIVNRYQRLNLARLDHEQDLVPGEPLSAVLPYVDFRMYVDALPDTAFVRVEHVWAAPDQAPLGPDILAISDAHYWNVDGLWPEGTVLRGRLLYSGANDTQLDHGLIAGSEAGICVVWRPSPGEPWQVYDGQEVSAGSLTNGTGFINLNDLKKGQYAFAKASAIVSVSEVEIPMPYGFDLYPVPAADRLWIKGETEMPSTLILDVLTLDGRSAQRSTTAANGPFITDMDIARLSPGAYLLRVMDTQGLLLGTRRFEVVR